MNRRAHVKRPGWVIDTPKGLRARQWSNGDLVVRHCGHPTALRPYYVDQLLDELGAFSLLNAAQHAAELAREALSEDPQALDTDEACWRIRATALGFGPDFPMPKH